jgi:hypothetical protein
MPKQSPVLNKSTIEEEELIELGNLVGALNTEVPTEREPTYEQAQAEIVLPLARKRGMNSRIILGKDRLSTFSSGYGGKGTPASNAIDLVVGLGSSYRDKGLSLDQDTVVGKNPFTDAARIYISQRTDLDTAFGITEGTKFAIDKPQRSSGGGVSGIGIKADTVLVVGRRNVKIKAGKSDAVSLGKDGETDAHGRKIDTADNKIELIGAQGLELEPMVLGNKLASALEKMNASINKNNLSIQKMILEIMQLRLMLILHIHGDPLTGVTLPSPDLAIGLINKLPKDLQDQAEGYIDALNKIIDDLNTSQIPNKDSYILSKTVFTT